MRVCIYLVWFCFCFLLHIIIQTIILGGGDGLVAKLCLALADNHPTTPWAVDHQDTLPMGFSRQEYWSGLPFPSPGDLLTQESNLGLLYCGHILD